MQNKQKEAETELAHLKGLFSIICRVELEEIIASQDREIAELQQKLDALKK